MSGYAHEKPDLDPEVEKQLPAPLADAIRRGSVPDEVLKHSHDADEALKAFASHQGSVIELDEATNKRLLRRVDWNLMPVCDLLSRYRLRSETKTTDHVRCIRIKLSRQDNHLVRICHGHSTGYRPQG